MARRQKPRAPWMPGFGRRGDPERGTLQRREKMATEIRGARADEMDEVLEIVPRVMGATREYFAAAYRNDPWARPEHSRIVKRDGQIVSHIRLYDRWQRVGPVPVR